MKTAHQWRSARILDLIQCIPAPRWLTPTSPYQSPMVAANRRRIDMKWKVVVLDLESALLAWAKGALCLLVTSAVGLADEPVAFQKLGAQFATEIRPILNESCMKCHSADEQKGTLDLEQFEKLADVRRATRTWQKVAEMLDNGEMPPKDAAQPSPEKRKRLRSWVALYLNAESLASAGDPGPVVLRRLSNAEYTYTLLDLIGVDLQPAREFPADGAAGEGFTNTGNALVMSPALLSKYLDAGKKIASHAVLLPDGIRFSPGATRRDWTNETLDRIRNFYARFTDSGGGTQVNLQGIVFGTNDGGRLPLEKYLAATIRHRDALASSTKRCSDVARDEGLNAKYLGILWSTLTGAETSPILDGVRARWRKARAGEAASLASEIVQWQKALWRFTSVGHIGKVGGPKAWMEPVSPLVSRQDLRLKMPDSASGMVTVYLDAGDAGDGNEHDHVVWEQPRLVASGRPDLLLRDVPAVAGELASLRERAFGAAARCLDAAAEAETAKGAVDLAELARRHGVEPIILSAWLDYLGVGTGVGTAVKIDTPLLAKITTSSGYDFIKGWAAPDLTNVVANSSSRHVRIPGNMKPHSVAMHPTPQLRVAAGWRSPVSAALSVEARVQHAHPECGNGVTWSLELLRGAVRQKLAAGFAQGAKVVKVGPVPDVSVQPGDLVSILIGPRDGNHACDLTAVDLTLSGGGRQWDLAREVSPDILAGNPHADAHGNPGVWHFYAEPDKGGTESLIPAGSLLARWQKAVSADERQRLARSLQDLLTSGPGAAKEGPDAVLYRQLAALRGPLVSAFRLRGPGARSDSAPAHTDRKGPVIGLDPSYFGKKDGGPAIDAASIAMRAPATLAIRLPAELVAGCEFVTSGVLEAGAGADGSVQLQLLAGRPQSRERVMPELPVVVRDGSAARRRFESAFDLIRQVFPPALCYTKIVPVDEVVTLTLFYREDNHLRRLMLDESQAAEIDRLWSELHFVSQDALTLVDAFLQLMEYATQDADPKVFEPMRKPINDRALAFRRELVGAEPRQLDAAIALAEGAYRRPLTAAEAAELRALYRKLRDEPLPHDEAIRLLLARVLVSPAFLYRLEKPAPGERAAPVNDWELASRLSYFLWSSLPDRELREAAGAGKLARPEVLAAQARRMSKDARIARLAREFACQWLHVYDFDSLDEKSERHFPTFGKLKGAMHEETILYFTDLFQNDGSVLSVFDGDHTFLNEALASHYGIPGVRGREWRRVDGIKKYGRGGILGLAATLARQSGASRTSPILRGNWVSEVLLGEKLPRPPKNVPVLPEDESATQGLTVRQLVEKHTSDPRCATCHVRIDPIGYALEAYDAIGRRRERDLGDRPIDTASRLRDGTQLDGLDGLRQYLVQTRRDAVLRQFCRKLLGYALGRGIQLSDLPLLEEMAITLKKNDYRFLAALETIVASRQFQDIRGRDAKM
jgi:Protein of unknown function (DUF1592)/Protein of unknown function (DUF1588)/Protein of unknown function (DUF1587)/Protein of unknown function (DUF1585)/Protein of unknown function (DUF1595)/Planctomycete cytochrome C